MDLAKEAELVALEQVVFKALEEDSDDLDSLLQEACEKMDGPRATRLLDKVHQVLQENVRDLTGWKK